MFLSTYRIIKFSLQDIFRNIWLSVVTITILILALFSINLLLVVQLIGNTAVEAVKDKIDVNLYIKEDVTEDQILALRANLLNLSQVKDIQYVSKAQALEDFKMKHEDSPEILQALKEVGSNPLTASLKIKPSNTDDVDGLINELNKIDDSIIESRNFADHKTMLAKINGITKRVSTVGMAISGIFVLISLLVVYNGLRVAIYTHRKEITIMRLVGASNKFIYMPFVISGWFYAFVGVTVIVSAFYPFLGLLQPYLETFFVGYNVDLVYYFSNNFVKIFGLQFLGVALINTVASLIAVKKYARV